jgi:hypothetical protein
MAGPRPLGRGFSVTASQESRVRDARLEQCSPVSVICPEASCTLALMPQTVSPSVTRLLHDDAGHGSIRPTGEYSVSRRYLDETMV